MAIQSFACDDTDELFRSGRNRRFHNIARTAIRKLDMLAAARSLLDLRSPPGNRLEQLSGDHAGQHSIRINDQWRICFVWTDNGPTAVKIEDYH